MTDSVIRYVVGVLIALGLLAVILVLIFTGGGSQSKPRPVNLRSFATSGGQVQLTIDGPVNAPSAHRAVRITISANSSEVDVIQGYNGNVISSHTSGNSQNSYRVFLNALQLAGFTEGQSGSGDGSGYCPTGERHIYRVISAGGSIEQNLWGSTCGGGTFAGNAGLVITLFQNQIPKYSQYTSGLGF